jgi:peptide/nickel transport system permease protein
VSNTVLVGATQKIPQLVLIETALTFIDLGDVGRRYVSFGETIREGFQGAYENPELEVWWIWVLPVVVLATTVIAFGVVGDALRDVFDPRGEP